MSKYDFDDYKAEMEFQISEVKKILTSLANSPKLNSSADKKRASLNYVKDRLNRATVLLRQLKSLLYDLPKNQGYEAVIDAFKIELDKLNIDYNFAISTSGDTTGNYDNMTAGEIIRKANEIAGDSIDSLNRSAQQVSDSQRIADITTGKLKEHTEELQRISQGIDAIDSNLTRADRQLRLFARRMGSDKVFIALIIVIIVVSVITIVLHFLKITVKGNTNTNTLPAG